MDQLQLVRLAMEAQGIAYGIAREVHGWRVVVPPAPAATAQQEVQAVLGEGLPVPKVLPKPQGDRGLGAAVLVLVLLWLLPGLAGLGSAPLAVTDWGVGDAAALRDGALWRVLTPLLLHGDVPHLLGNSPMALLSWPATLGPWLGSAYALDPCGAGSGSANGVNLTLAGDGFRSLGASTALFAAFGVFGVGRLQQGAPMRPRIARSHALGRPLGAGLIWLLLFGLGGGDKRVDVGAHLWGFAAGVLLTLANPFRPAPAGPLGALGAWPRSLWDYWPEPGCGPCWLPESR